MLSTHRSRPRRIEWLVSGSVLLFLVGIFGVGGHFQFCRLEPPSDVQLLDEFAQRMPAPRRLAIVRGKGGPSIVWVGDRARFPALPSGPPTYLFDRNGRLVDWCLDNGEGHPLGKLAFQGKEISLAEALELTNAAH